MKRRTQATGFSLIEVLLAVMLLTVLMLVAFPAFRGMQRASNRHRAAGEARALAQAASAYRRVYGQWPLEETATPGEATALIAGRGVGEHLSLSNVVAALRAADRALNPRAIDFLELPDDRLDADGTLLDPWRQPYVLLLARVAVDADGRATVGRAEGGVSTTVLLDGTAIVVNAPDEAAAFSWGDPADARTASERLIGSWVVNRSAEP